MKWKAHFSPVASCMLLGIELFLGGLACLDGVTLGAEAPHITTSTSLQSQAVNLGDTATFSVSASGDAPLSFQWRFNGLDLLGKTNRSLTVSKAQAADEGDYSIVVTNAVGQATGEPVRLWVVPPGPTFHKGNFTNATGLRLPYFYFLPEKFSSNQSYPLMCWFHGTPGDETVITNANYGYPGYANYAPLKVLVSYGQQQTDPIILFWPTRRAGDSAWTDSYLQLAAAALDQFMAQFHLATNRVYIGGASEGFHAAWDLIAMRPGLFAAGSLAAGWQGKASASAVAALPFWIWCAADDSEVVTTREAVGVLREAGARTIYTEYSHGGHYGSSGSPGGVDTGSSTPEIVNWMLAQRRGGNPQVDPLLLITEPSPESSHTTSATTLNLAGSAGASGQPITGVTWTNSANHTGGLAVGTNRWAVQAVPLVADVTNVVVVIGATTSWSALGGNTSFNDTLAIASSPIRVRLDFQASGLVLDWSGGGPPYSVQSSSDIVHATWTDAWQNAVPPLTVRTGAGPLFFRVQGH